jgi:hypothetical protein
LTYIQSPRLSLDDTTADPIYQQLLPTIVAGGVTYRPVDGIATLPPPHSRDRPFATSDPLYSLFAVPAQPLTGNEPDTSGAPVTAVGSSVSLLIQLEEEVLVGGICYAGYPYLSSRMESGPAGTTAANHGLPREVRVTALPSTGTGSLVSTPGFRRMDFLDAEFAYTSQEIASHSSFQHLCIDPVRTNHLIVMLADFPRIPRQLEFDASSGAMRLASFYGYAVPYFYVFQYREATRKVARLRAGVIGVRTAPASAPANPLEAAFPEYEFTQPDAGATTGVYMQFSAHSAFGQRRFYNLSYGYTTLDDAEVERPGREPRKGFDECFVSEVLQPGESVCVFVQQAEEYERCVAGLKAVFLTVPDHPTAETPADMLLALLTSSGTADGELTADERSLVEDLLAYYAGLPAETDFCERLRVSIYELDPPDGVAAASLALDSPYATLLHRSELGRLGDVLVAAFLQGLRFTRTSTSRYFAIELTNIGSAAGQAAIHTMSLVRSAHVAMQPRASCVRHLKALHYRFVGPHLADDYAQIGREGFNFSIDRTVAGQPKQVLYGAKSLIDLLHTGNARMHANVRRRAAEFERVESFVDVAGQRRGYQVRTRPDDDLARANEERRETDADTTGWRETESGRDVVWPLDKGAPEFEAFDNYSGTEVRAHVEHVSSLIDRLLTGLQNLPLVTNNRIDDFVSLVVRPDTTDGTVTASDVLFRNEGPLGQFSGIWRPFSRFGFDGANLPSITGVQTLNVPPYYLTVLDGLAGLTRMTSDYIAGRLDLEQLTEFTSSEWEALVARLALVNGYGFGLNLGGSTSRDINLGPVTFGGGLSGGYSISTSSNLVSAARTTTNGAQGTLSQIGQELKYLLNRILQRGWDNSIVTTTVHDSESKRIVSRRELLDRDTERVRGAEVLWQGTVQDIVTGSVPLNVILPATAAKTHRRTVDEGLRVRFNSGFSPEIEVDFWFELSEEPIRDDY